MLILIWRGICLRLFGAMLKYAYCCSFDILIFSLSHLSNMCTMQVPPTETIPQIKRKNIVLKLKIEQKGNLQKECFFPKKTWRLFLPMPLLLPRCWDNWTWSWCRSNDRCHASHPGEECPALQLCSRCSLASQISEECSVSKELGRGSWARWFFFFS